MDEHALLVAPQATEKAEQIITKSIHKFLVS